MNLDSEIGYGLILKAIENDNKETIYNKWLHDDARYEKNFDDYYKEHIPYRKSTVSEKDEILRKYGGD